MDVPMYLKLHRLVQPMKLKHGLSDAVVGYTVSVDCFGHGVVVYVRQGVADGTLKVMVKDGDGMSTLVTYTKDEGE